MRDTRRSDPLARGRWRNGAFVLRLRFMVTIGPSSFATATGPRQLLSPGGGRPTFYAAKGSIGPAERADITSSETSVESCPPRPDRTNQVSLLRERSRTPACESPPARRHTSAPSQTYVAHKYGRRNVGVAKGGKPFCTIVEFRDASYKYAHGKYMPAIRFAPAACPRCSMNRVSLN
jgi:hypothetical protein